MVKGERGKDITLT